MRRVAVLGMLMLVGVVASLGRPVAQGNVADIEQVKENLYMITGGGGNTAAFGGPGVMLPTLLSPSAGGKSSKKVTSGLSPRVARLLTASTRRAAIFLPYRW